MAIRYLIIVSFLLASFPSSSIAGGVVTSITGTSLAKKPEKTWHTLEAGEVLETGMTLWVGASSLVTLTVNEDIIKIPGGKDGQEITIINLNPFQAARDGNPAPDIGPAVPPAPPLLSAPANATVMRESETSLSWSSSEKEALFHLQLSATPDFSSIVMEERTYNNEKKISGLVPGKYFWRVLVINKEGVTGKYSPVNSFEVRSLPTPPALGSPASTKTSTTFRWKRKSDSERYHLQIARDANFSEIVVDLPFIEGPRVTVGSMEEGDYFVRISTVDEDGFEGAFSEMQSFYVGPRVHSADIAPLMIMFGVAFMLLGL